MLIVPGVNCSYSYLLEFGWGWKWAWLAMTSDIGQNLLLILNASPCFYKTTLLERHMAEPRALLHEVSAFIYILIDWWLILIDWLGVRMSVVIGGLQICYNCFFSQQLRWHVSNGTNKVMSVVGSCEGMFPSSQLCENCCFWLEKMIWKLCCELTLQRFGIWYQHALCG